MKHPFSLEGKKILITGATSGIGSVIATTCAKMGAQLIISGRDVEKLRQVFASLEGEGHSQIPADFEHKSDINHLLEQLPLIDGAVFSSGINKRLPLKMLQEEKLNQVMELNFSTQAAILQQLYKSKKLNIASSVVYISSISSQYAAIGNIAYMASKGALESFVKGAAFELASQQIRVNGVRPGMVKTKLSAAFSDEELEALAKDYPLKRLGEPEDVAHAVVYLLSDAASWTTGTMITVDGGLTLR